MLPIVAATFYPFTDSLEGFLSFMYLDSKGLVTTGRGNLIDPYKLAITLPWRHKSDSTPANYGEIAAEWARIEARQELAGKGGGIFAMLTTLYLTNDAIDALSHARLTANDAAMAKTFPNWEAMPADAQLGILSMCWAMGPGFPAGFPHFTHDINHDDYQTASFDCMMSEVNNAPLHPRNVANVSLFKAAAYAVNNSLPYDTIRGWGPQNPLQPV